MLSIGIIWNSVYDYKDEIIHDISNRVDFKYSFDLDLDSFFSDFVFDIYNSESMETWKIEKKLNNMVLNQNRKVTIVIYEFDDTKVFYHEFKHKEVYEQLEFTKRYIRERYSQYIDNYVFDIVFHSTDNLQELGSVLTVINKYQEFFINEPQSFYKQLLLNYGEKNE